MHHMARIMEQLIVFMVLFVLSIQSVDYCANLDNVPGIPRTMPLRSGFVKPSHRKNVRGWYLMAQELNMTIESDIANVDIAWGAYEPIETPKNRLTLFGPEFDIFPTFPTGGPRMRPSDRYTEGHCFYTTLCDWNNKVHAGMNGMRWPLLPFPFPVDMQLFQRNMSSPKKGGFLYTKRRSQAIIDDVVQFLTAKGVTTDLQQFHYGSYKEMDYLNALQTAEWGVWIGQHESQGFGLEEALAMGVPLLVLDVATMRDENGPCPTSGTFCYMDSAAMLNATSVPYWDDKCGERVTSVQELALTWDLFQHRRQTGRYDPRQTMQRLVSPKACAQRLMTLYDYHRQVWCQQYLDGRSGRAVKNYYQLSIPSVEQLWGAQQGTLL